MGNESELAGVYGLLSQLAPLILEHQGNGTMSAVMLRTNDPPQKVKVGNYTLEVTLCETPRRVWHNAIRSKPRPQWRCSLRRGLTSTSWWATA